MFRLIVRHKVSLTNWILESYMPKIQQLPGVTDVVRMNWFGGAYIDQKPENMFARFSTSDAERLLKVFDEASIVQGSAKDWISDRSGAPRGRAPHEEVRLEARAEDHAQGRHLPDRTSS